MNRKLLLVLALLVAGSSHGALKVWVSGESLRAADLNANFTEVNTAATALVTNAKVSGSAAIAHSKMATPTLIPKIVVSVAASCAATPCTMTINSGATSVTRAGGGQYSVTFPTRGNAVYAPMVSVISASDVRCTTSTQAATSTAVLCYNGAGVAVDSGFTFLLLDDN